MLWKEGERGEGKLCIRGAFLYHQWFITKARPRPDGHCMSWCVRPQTFQNTKFEYKTFCVTVCVCSKLSKYIRCVLVLIDQLRKSLFWFDKFIAVQWITSAQFSNYSLKMVKWPLNVRTWWRCAWSSWEDKWLPNGRPMFILRSREKRKTESLWATFIVVAPTVWRERNWRLLSMSKTMPTASKLSEAPSCRLISVPRWTFAKFSLKDMAWRGWGGEVSWQNAKCRDCRQKCTFESSKVKNHRRALFL